MTEYVAVGLWQGRIQQIRGITIEKAAINFTEHFGYDPIWIFTETELQNATNRKIEAYLNY